MFTLFVGVVTIAALVGVCYGIGYFLHEKQHPIEVGMKLLTILGWFLLISYGIGWIVVQAVQPIL
jgi:ascorbate-specific PTS system EIIC-type component UlaA